MQTTHEINKKQLIAGWPPAIQRKIQVQFKDLYQSFKYKLGIPTKYNYKITEVSATKNALQSSTMVGENVEIHFSEMVKNALQSPEFM